MDFKIYAKYLEEKDQIIKSAGTISISSEKGDFQYDDEKEKDAIFVEANHSHHGTIGGAGFVLNHETKSLHPIDTEVHEDHRRKGVANSMYRHAEAKTGYTVVRADDLQSPDALALWGQKNRPFGHKASVAKSEARTRLRGLIK